METVFSIDERLWTSRRPDLKNDYLYTSEWWCDDGDGVELYIKKDEGGFELHCFSGIPSSSIFIDVCDFGTMWRKAKKPLPIRTYSYVQQCIIIADYLCGIFCEYRAS